MKKKIALIDVDECLVESGKRWLAWLVVNADPVMPSEIINQMATMYNMDQIIKPYLPDNFDPMAFWHSDELYDNMYPRSDALQGLMELKSYGYDLYAVTYCIGNHFSSKAKFIEKHFSGVFSDMIATGSKHMIRGDLIIDDRLKYLVPFGPETIKILFKSPYKQCTDGHPDFVLDSWSNIGNILEQIE